MRPKQRLILLLFLTLVVGALLGAMALTRPGYRAESQALDRFFPWRYQLFGPQRIDPRVVLVGHQNGGPFRQTDAALAERPGRAGE
jgi:CHASE2 domain-containing sensor protein